MIETVTSGRADRPDSSVREITILYSGGDLSSGLIFQENVMRLNRLVVVLNFLCLPTLTMAQGFDDNFPGTIATPKEQLKPIAPASETIGKIELKDDLKAYPIWLLIQPQGVRFLQSDEEIAVHQNSIPHHAFLVGCHEAEFKAVRDAEDRSFLLSCQDFALLGSYGTKQFAEIKGMSLAYSTKTNQIQLQGEKDAPVEARLNHPDTETLMQAEVINLTLKSDFIPKTQYDQRNKPSTRSVLLKTNFQMNAANISSLSISGVGVPVDDESENTISKGKVNLLPTY